MLQFMLLFINYLFLFFICKSKLGQTWLARAKVLGFPDMPKHIADTMVDFPVPLGPRIKLRFGPGRTSTSL